MQKPRPSTVLKYRHGGDTHQAVYQQEFTEVANVSDPRRVGNLQKVYDKVLSSKAHRVSCGRKDPIYMDPFEKNTKCHLLSIGFIGGDYISHPIKNCYGLGTTQCKR